MKRIDAVFIWFAPCGLLSTVAGLCAAYLTNRTRCPNLTISFMWELVPVSAYVLLFIGSIFWLNQIIEKQQEKMYSFYEILIWGAVVHGLFVLPVGFMIFPTERFFNVGVTCSYFGDSYINEVIAPFLLAQSLSWVVSLIGVSWCQLKLQKAS